MNALAQSYPVTYTELETIPTDSEQKAGMSVTSNEITQLLQGWRDGDEDALEKLAPLIFDDLRQMASRYLRRESSKTLQSTALVNEVFLRLLNKDSVTWKNSSHFFGFVALEMRRILIDHARRKKASMRGGGQEILALEEAMTVAARQDIDLVALDDALKDLSQAAPDLSRIVDLRFIVGLSHKQISEVEDISVATARRRWGTAKTWLFRQLRVPRRPDDLEEKRGAQGTLEDKAAESGLNFKR